MFLFFTFQQEVKKLASLNDCKFHNKFNDSVTHVIVRPGELFCINYNPLMMVHSKYIYEPRSVKTCLNVIRSFNVNTKN